MVTKLAAQLYTMREYTKTADMFRQVLQVCHEIGYAGVQLSAIGCMNGDAPEVDARAAKEMLENYGLVCCATHRPWKRLVENIDEEIEFHKVLGCDYTAVGSISGEYGFGPDGYRQFLADAIPVIEKLKSEGIRFGYHNHAHEFIRNPETKRPCYDILIDEGGADLMLEVDTYWAVVAGIDAAALLARGKARVPVIHVKDMEVVEKIGSVMCPVGEGNLDWPHIVQVCEDSGTEWYVVEQDDCRRDPVDCLRSSWEYLSELQF
ncbi:MAG: sugar phosphate isomerase/epimerase [Fimbriimonas sp.]|nr:sugar phosphate isomerase/epimerase [Fimbriimonas sp.]